MKSIIGTIVFIEPLNVGRNDYLLTIESSKTKIKGVCKLFDINTDNLINIKVMAVYSTDDNQTHIYYIDKI